MIEGRAECVGRARGQRDSVSRGRVLPAGRRGVCLCDSCPRSCPWRDTALHLPRHLGCIMASPDPSPQLTPFEHLLHRHWTQLVLRLEGGLGSSGLYHSVRSLPAVPRARGTGTGRGAGGEVQAKRRGVLQADRGESVVIICVQSGVSLTKGAGLFIFVFPVALSQVPALQMHQQAFTEQMTQE